MLFGVGCTPEGGETAGDEALAEITVSPTSFATTLEGGEQVVTVTSNATWTVSCDQADVTVEPLTGNGNGSVTITVPAASAREFKVVFDAQKQTSIPALGTSTTTTAKAEVTVSQNDGGVNLDDYLYHEDCGDGSISVSDKPYVDKYTGWSKKGEAAINVVYGGTSASVRHSGNSYQPTEDAVGVSGAPYVFLNKVPASAYFLIKDITITGGSNYIFAYNVQCQSAYVDGKPVFANVDGSLVHLELSYDGVAWAEANCTYAPNGGNGWYAVQAEFKTAADATKLYARLTYEAPASNGGGRFDDFKLVAGGNGGELDFTVTPTPDPTPDPTPSDAYFYESFAAGQGAFTTKDVTLSDGLTYVWKHDASYACMKASAYSGSAKASESWLISPEFSLTGATSPVLSFDHAINYAKGTAAEALTLWVKESTATEWTQVTIPSYPASDSWTFYPAGSADLSAYVDKTIQIAFKYTSTTSIAATWEVKNVKVAEGNGSTTEPEQPGQGGGETPETPATGYNFNSDTALVCNTNNSTNCVYTCTVKANGSSAVNGNGFKLGKSSAAGVFTSGALGVTGEATLEFYACAWTGKTAKLYIRLEGSEENLAVIDLASNSGATGNADPYTITYSENEYHTVQLTGLTADSKLQFSTSSSFTAAADSKTSRALVVGVHVK